jgi:hypothetical protein
MVDRLLHPTDDFGLAACVGGFGREGVLRIVGRLESSLPALACCLVR